MTILHFPAPASAAVLEAARKLATAESLLTAHQLQIAELRDVIAAAPRQGLARRASHAEQQISALVTYLADCHPGEHSAIASLLGRHAFEARVLRAALRERER